MVDNKTAHLALPLPDLSNMQDEDVPRIGGALSMLDAHAQQVDSALRGVDSALESQGRDVAELKAGSQTQTGNLDALSRALETEKAERSDADRVASANLLTLTTGQNDLAQRVGTLGETSADHGARLDAAEQKNTQQDTRLKDAEMSLAGKLNANMSNRPAGSQYVTVTWTDGWSWFRKYSDGFIMQGGFLSYRSDTPISITLPCPFASTYYTVIPHAFHPEPDSGHSMVASRSTSSFVLRKTSASAEVNWLAFGY